MGSFVRTNYRIRVPTVRLIGADGAMLGVMPTRDAQRLAQEQSQDLVEVSPNADPPVCKIMDFGKYRYEEGMRRKQARKSQARQQIKEVKFHASVDEHDLQTKLRHMRDFLAEGDKVKITLQYRGRENAHKELGFELVNRLIRELDAVSHCEQQPRLMGRILNCLLAPRPPKPSSAKSAPPATAAAKPPATPPVTPATTPPATTPPTTPPATPAATPPATPAAAPAVAPAVTPALVDGVGSSVTA